MSNEGVWVSGCRPVLRCRPPSAPTAGPENARVPPPDKGCVLEPHVAIRAVAAAGAPATPGRALAQWGTPGGPGSSAAGHAMDGGAYDDDDDDYGHETGESCQG